MFSNDYLDKKNSRLDLGKLRNIILFCKNSFPNLHICENYFIHIKCNKEWIYDVRLRKEFEMIDMMKILKDQNLCIIIKIININISEKLKIYTILFTIRKCSYNFYLFHSILLCNSIDYYKNN